MTSQLRLRQRQILGQIAFLLVCGVVCSIFQTSTALAQSSTKTPSVPANHPLAPAMKLALQSKKVLKSVKDYEAQFTKRELIGRRLITQQMDIRARKSPFSVYLKFKQPHTGREIIYVDGQNRNMLLAHEGSGIASLVGTVSLSPKSADAMKDNRYPITSIGIHKMLDIIIDQWEEEGKYGEIDVKFYPNAKLGETNCQVIESSHPSPKKQFKFHRTRLFLDKETKLPIRVEQYGFPAGASGNAPLIEEYTYTKIRTNVGLGDYDFDRRNPRYQF